jgi:Zn-dependent protease
VNPAPRAAALRLRFFGIPVEVQATFFVIVGLLGWAGSVPNLLLWIGIAFASILLHELGHALTARAFGSPTSILIYGFGGLTSHQRMSVKRDLLVTLAGPGAGLLAGAVLLLIAKAVGTVHGAAHVALVYALWINIGWSVINLLPVLPLDGGNAMRATVHLVTGRDREQLVRQTSIAVAVIGGLVALRAGFLFTALLAVFFIGDNMRALRQRKDASHAAQLRAAETQLHANDPNAVVAAADEVLSQRPDPTVSSVAQQLKAWALLQAHDIAGAQAAVDALPQGAAPSFHLQAALHFAQHDNDHGLAFAVEGFRRQAPGGKELMPYVADAGQATELADRLLHIEPEYGLPAAFATQVWLHQAGRYSDAVAVAQRIVHAPGIGSAMVAFNAACSCALAGRSDDAFAWLQQAVDAGFTDTNLFDTDPDLASLRALPRFAELEARMRARN